MSDITKITPVPSIINNKPIAVSKTYDVIKTDDPRAQEVLHKVSCVGVKEAAEAVAAAKAAHPAWRNSTLQERRAILEKAAALLKERAPEYAKLFVEETVLSFKFAMFDLLGLTLGHIEEASAHMSTALNGDLLPSHGPFGAAKRNLVTREPFPVVLGIAPWNAPGILCVRAFVYAIAAGCCVVLKTSEFSPRTHLLMADLFYAAGLPEGVLNVVHVDPKDAPEVIESIIANEDVGFVNFTGSTRVGKILAQTCGKYVKPCIMELGGKAPMIVLKDGNLDVVANHLLMAGYLGAGQVCMSTNNVFVHKDVAAQLTEKVQAAFKEHKIQADRSQAGGIRALFSPASGQRVQGLYEDAVSKGAKVAAGTPGFDGALVQPVLLMGVNPKMEIFATETFGPVHSLVEFDDVNEVVKLVNSNPQAGLSASVYSADETAAWMVARDIESGAVHINGPSIHDHGSVPHGGVKLSGFGRFNGAEGIKSHTYMKTYTFSPAYPLPLDQII